MNNFATIPTKKTLGVFAITMINVIAVDSLRSLPFSAVFGFSLVFYYLLAAIVFFLPTAFIAAELATTWPNRGGIYVWVREAFGERWGFITVWLQWIYNVVWYPTILAFLAGTLAYLISPTLADNKIYMLVTIIGVFWCATLLNCFGMRLSSWVSTFAALIGTLIPMLAIIILGAIWLLQDHPAQIIFDTQHFLPNLSNLDNLGFLLVVLFGLFGMEMSATHADEVREPKRTFPRAIFYSTILIFFSLVFSSLAIAVVVPKNELNVVVGLVQAYQLFLANYHLEWLTPLVAALIIIGGIGNVAAWIIGPTKGLLVATIDGSAPPFFGKINRHGVPYVILLMQAIICTILCSIFLLMPSVSASYWVLSAITAQLAMLMYILFFAAAIYLRRKKPEVQRAYRVPGGRFGIWIMGVLGILSAIGAIALGFLPPAQVKIGDVWQYELLLFVGIIILAIPPLIIYAIRRPHWKISERYNYDNEIRSSGL